MTDTTPTFAPHRTGSVLDGALAQVLVGIGILAAMALALDLLGRPLACECGTVALWDGDPHSPGASQQFADWYSVLHVMFGMGLFVFIDRMRPDWPLSWKLLTTLASSAVWEAMENMPFVIAVFGNAEGAPSYSGDSILNAVGDTVFVVLGFFGARLLSTGGLVLALVALELVVAVAIRDGFLLGSLRILGVSV